MVVALVARKNETVFTSWLVADWRFWVEIVQAGGEFLEDQNIGGMLGFAPAPAFARPFTPNDAKSVA